MDEQNPYGTTELPGFSQHTVSSLMCVRSREWEEDILRDMFSARDQTYIRSIMLYDTDVDDH